jgi:hypothetical protein
MVNGVDVVDDADMWLSVIDIWSPLIVETSARILFFGQILCLIELSVSI